ncbi:hypothetical protein ANN_00298 [Periplaneta americana]|uniref:Uncharacterized protein n=1 Tax=Periplaneta americana TaxID=6978 RepID=A0ABQ8TSR8_PERAM|nr:hypothetical protein ANN_00298 [Periplaneta americana]
MPSSKRNKKMMGSYLAEYVYRKWRFHNKTTEECFHSCLSDIATVYPAATCDEVNSSPEQAGPNEETC